MDQSLESHVFRFFDEYIDVKRPILIALSGGADSICLMHLLLEWQKRVWQKKEPFSLHIVHVDHGWRKESVQEAEALKALAATLGLPFHMTRLSPEKYSGNLEAESRKERLVYFQKVVDKTGAQAIVLAHHADDQAETVFKRFLEGASLPYLSAMASLYTIDSLRIMRPLLDITKKEILAWLSARSISYFQDPTNFDTRFLRAKMRTEIFPFLRASFGKEFDRNLCEIAKEAGDLRHYLDERHSKFLKKIVAIDWGILVEVGEIPLKAKFEWHYFLRKVAKQVGIVMHRAQVALVCDLLLSRKANKQLLLGEQAVICDRGHAFFTTGPLVEVSGMQKVVTGTYHFGVWKVVVKKEGSMGSLTCKNHWKDAWLGSCYIAIPDGNYFFARGEPQMRRKLGSDGHTKKLNHFLAEKKVPHFLMSKVPMILTSSLIVEDFLTGTPPQNCEGPMLHITIQRERESFKD